MDFDVSKKTFLNKDSFIYRSGAGIRMLCSIQTNTPDVRNDETKDNEKKMNIFSRKICFLDTIPERK